MAAIISGANLTAFNALDNLEQQVAFLMGQLLVAQNTYNTANPTTPKNVVAVSPSYSTNVAAFQCQFPIEGDSVLQALHENVTAAL
ncbi:hypothetical protein H6G54_00785 [Anabaena cylindrica FACHB-243]|uniref:Uncharacterized protein n=1 Tax=Anabaena cylindrica (strain ATCC 27899 / PCC 7122) TaxID=272123 RepID=K9ZKT7_ANACC|nr:MULTISPECIES: hypothetical protein [Anabaena]AFZ59384.1 hypothetical protein Anacy_4014 [Anabaena cylindrica PCC 7122]MBD2416272.1 hypothetical protein [Anabaena cylindrica FACHB-243]MBY5280234.1 hypothetical protein [Anabaena sp. CCAP 1446/1C]MBY5308506.1 hypothetical protein [Anabaena sp. CCAP 1446/1C]MCM2405302.1 hypothetical protein [Anabaena sp. CCAP 1446/1C]